MSSSSCILISPFLTFIIDFITALRKRWKEINIQCKLEICYATYGHPSLPNAYEVSKVCQDKVDLLWFRDRLHYKKVENLNQIFGEGAGLPERKWDPCPGENKQLKIRYRMLGQHAMCQLDVLPNGQLSSNFMLIAPKERYLIINRATYGHPKGLSPQGRMSIDITEVVQGLVDAGMAGGSYLTLSHMTPIKRIFGDPCPGYPKDLRINFEICGRNGVEIQDEIRGNLIKRLHIEYAPTIKPLIFVSAATYGISPSGRRQRMDDIRKLLKKIDGIEHRKMNGHMPNAEELDVQRQKDQLKKDFIDLRDAEISFVDIRDKLQRLCDAGGPLLELHADRFDCNAAFGNPAPGKPKILEISVESPGHDAERETDSEEMTSSGHPRNFITNKSAKFCVAVQEIKDEGLGGTAKGKLRETVRFSTDLSAPVIHITRATYGILDDPLRVIDCSLEVQSMVKGRMLHIGTEVNLTKAFSKDPCPGMRKQLRVEYVTRGFIGQVRVREKDDVFITNVELGYPPVPMADL